MKNCLEIKFVVFFKKMSFFKKTLTDDLNWWLVVTLVENKYCTEKDEYV